MVSGEGKIRMLEKEFVRAKNVYAVVVRFLNVSQPRSLGESCNI